MMTYFQALTDLDNITESAIRICYGGKALGLWQMHTLFLPIPKTWVIDASLFKQFIKVNQSVEFDSKVAEQFISGHIGKELSDLSAGEYAIRSSATQEDSKDHSFAGIFASELHIKKSDLVEAVASKNKTQPLILIENF